MIYNNIGTNLDYGTMGAGFYFTSDRQNAQNYANNAEGEGEANVTLVYLDIKNPKEVKWNELDGESTEKSENMTEKWRKKGYDGFVATAPNGATWYVASEPEQIKSATDNSGEFDPKNEDIRYSRSFGGNSRYAGYSKSRRAVIAEF